MQGKTEIKVQHNESLMSFLLFKGIKLKGEESTL
jgi:hypothetical protein